MEGADYEDYFEVYDGSAEKLTKALEEEMLYGSFDCPEREKEKLERRRERAMSKYLADMAVKEIFDDEDGNMSVVEDLKDVVDKLSVTSRYYQDVHKLIRLLSIAFSLSDTDDYCVELEKLIKEYEKKSPEDDDYRETDIDKIEEE